MSLSRSFKIISILTVLALVITLLANPVNAQIPTAYRATNTDNAQSTNQVVAISVQEKTSTQNGTYDPGYDKCIYEVKEKNEECYKNARTESEKQGCEESLMKNLRNCDEEYGYDEYTPQRTTSTIVAVPVIAEKTESASISSEETLENEYSACKKQCYDRYENEDQIRYCVEERCGSILKSTQKTVQTSRSRNCIVTCEDKYEYCIKEAERYNNTDKYKDYVETCKLSFRQCENSCFVEQPEQSTEVESRPYTCEEKCELEYGNISKDKYLTCVKERCQQETATTPTPEIDERTSCKLRCDEAYDNEEDRQRCFKEKCQNYEIPPRPKCMTICDLKLKEGAELNKACAQVFNVYGGVYINKCMTANDAPTVKNLCYETFGDAGYERCFETVTETNCREKCYDITDDEEPQEYEEEILYPIPVEPTCNGCKLNGTCLNFGYRLVEDGYAMVCTMDGLVKQKETGSSCNNDFECKTNFCMEGICSSKQDIVSEVIKAIQKMFGWQ